MRLQSEPGATSNWRDALHCYLSLDDNAGVDVSEMILQGRLNGVGVVGSIEGVDDEARSPAHSVATIPVVFSLRAVADAGWHRIKVRLFLFFV